MSQIVFGLFGEGRNSPGQYEYRQHKEGDQCQQGGEEEFKKTFKPIEKEPEANYCRCIESLDGFTKGLIYKINNLNILLRYISYFDYSN